MLISDGPSGLRLPAQALTGMAFMQLAKKNHFGTTQEEVGFFSLSTCATPSLVGGLRRDLCFLKHKSSEL